MPARVVAAGNSIWNQAPAVCAATVDHGAVRDGLHLLFDRL
jgi:hypothetical protein